MTTFEIDPGRLFIGGQWREAADGARTEVVDPSRGAVVTTVAEAGAADVDAAVRAAREAFDAGQWSGLSGRERGRVLLRVAELIRAEADEIARLESLDVGKPITLAHAVDVTNAANDYEYFASLAFSLDGANRDTPMNALAYTKRGPIGVVAAITPFNFPLILAGSKIAPALAAGNTVVHKPADETPLSALYMAGLLQRAAFRTASSTSSPAAGRSPERRCCGTPASTRSPSPAPPRSVGTPRASRARTSSRSPWNSAATRRTSSSRTPTWRRPSARSSRASSSTPASSAWAARVCWWPARSTAPC